MCINKSHKHRVVSGCLYGPLSSFMRPATLNGHNKVRLVSKKVHNFNIVGFH